MWHNLAGEQNYLDFFNRLTWDRRQVSDPLMKYVVWWVWGISYEIEMMIDSRDEGYIDRFLLAHRRWRASYARS